MPGARPGSPRRLGRITALVALALALGWPAGEARAEGEPRIIVIAPARDDRISLRLQAELRALRFDVPEVEIAPGPPSREHLEQAARRSDAVAAVRIVPSSAGVEVWIVDRVTGKTVLREMVRDDAGSAASDATLALRVVELLRASLMELHASRPPRGEVEAPATIRDLIDLPRPALLPAPPPPRTPPLSVELGPALLLSPGGLGPSALVSAAVHLRPSERIGATLFALVPVSPATVSGREGVTSAWIGLLGAGVRALPGPPGSAWTPSVGAGLSAVWLRLDGKPAPSYVGKSDNLVTVAPYLRAGLGLTLVPYLRVRADVLGGLALLRPVIAFGDRVAARWGQPFVAPSLGVEFVWR